MPLTIYVGFAEETTALATFAVMVTLKELSNVILVLKMESKDLVVQAPAPLLLPMMLEPLLEE